MRKTVLAVIAALVLAPAPSLLRNATGGPAPSIVAKAVEYKDGDAALEGWLVYDDAVKEKRPGVVVVHEWWGLTDYPKTRCEMLAKLGYVAFAIDMYGKGKTTKDPKQAGEWSGQFHGDGKAAGRRRAKAGFDVLAKDEHVDASRMGAMGYCFGGTVALEMAWSDLPLKGVVSFHGQPSAPDAEDHDQAAVLVCHGGDDGFVKDATLKTFEDTMREKKIDWTLVKYGHAVHSFTNPDSDKFGIPGVGYDKRADERSWAHMRTFWYEVFAK